MESTYQLEEIFGTSMQKPVANMIASRLHHQYEHQFQKIIHQHSLNLTRAYC